MATNYKSVEDTSRSTLCACGSAVASMPLDALRDSRQLTQVKMAQLLNISQGAVSKVERRNDMFVSTLRNYVRAIGGNLQIRAVFPEGDVVIDQFDRGPEEIHREMASYPVVPGSGEGEGN